MHYVKQFNINGVDTMQVACIELSGKPNTATEGAVGLLGIDMSSPLHEIYKCVAVNGSIYTWELFSSGMSIVSATVSGGGEKSVQFSYDSLKMPLTYMVKVGDLILDNEGYLYQVDSLNATYCGASYCGTQVVAYGKSAYDLAVQQGFEGTLDEWLATIKGEPGATPVVGENNHWWIDGVDTGVDIALKTVERGSYVGTGVYGKDKANVLTFERPVKMLIILPARSANNTTKYFASSVSDSFSAYGSESPLMLFGVDYEASVYKNMVTLYVTQFDTTVSWYTPNNSYSSDGSTLLQRNEAGKIYEYIAFM